MLSMKGREKYKKAVERMRALGCESQEEIIAGLENEIDRLKRHIMIERESKRTKTVDERQKEDIYINRKDVFQLLNDMDVPFDREINSAIFKLPCIAVERRGKK